MPKFTLFHLLPEFARDAYFAEFPMSAYKHVATVEAEALGHVFQLTNHGVPGEVDDWTKNAGITLWGGTMTAWGELRPSFGKPLGYRSTSVGDVIGDEAGDFYRVEGVGFKKLTGWA